ncbi:MAG: M20 aminoacylase family protein [bacterium]
MREIIQSYLDDLIPFRRDLHKHPELGFEEARTSDSIAGQLESFGLAVERGLGKTGLVGILKNGSSEKSISLRADMDALPIQEENDFKYRSVNDGKMHACGHDGHVVMLLGAARYLAETRNFNGTAYFIFQPAEEGGAGAKAMIEDGLFEKFPAKAVFGMHNRSGLEEGKFATRTGIIMAATDNFEITVMGRGTHAAMPHTGIDPVVTASQVVTALQTVVSRTVKPIDNSVISVTCFHAGTAYNVIPGNAVLKGCIRTQTPEVRDQVRTGIDRVLSGICAAHGAEYEFTFLPGYLVTVNTEEETQTAIAAAVQVVGEENVDQDTQPLMASEDFSYYLEKVPGSYMFIGNGAGEGGPVSHRSDYDFNDQIIPLGVEYWVRLVENQLML